MKKIDITSEIDTIKRQLIEKYHPEKIILFGSAAWGDTDEVNDLDFFIVKKDCPYYGIDRMRELDRIIDRDIAVDMIVYRPEEVAERLGLGDPFVKKIFREGRILYG